ITQTAGTLWSGTSGEAQFGWTGGSDGHGSRSLYMSDIYIDNGSDLTDPAYYSTAKQYASQDSPAVHGFTSKVGSFTNNWDGVSNRPADNAQAWRENGATQQTETYLLQAASAGDEDISGATIVGWQAWVIARTYVSSGTAKLVDNGVDVDVNLTTTANDYTHWTTSDTYPSSGAFGMKSTGTDTDTEFLEGGVVFVFEAVVAAGVNVNVALVSQAQTISAVTVDFDYAVEVGLIAQAQTLPGVTVSTGVAPTFMSAGGNEALDDVPTFASASGTVGYSTEQHHTGPGSIKYDTGASAIAAYNTSPTDVLNDAGSRFSTWLYLTDVRAWDNVIHLLVWQAAASNAVWGLQRNTDTLWRVVSSSGTVLGSGTLAITTGWHRISAAHVITSATSFTIKVWVDGTLLITATTGTLNYTSSSRLLVGERGATPAANKVMYASDVYVDNGSDLTDPGDIRTTVKLPASDGSREWNGDMPNPAYPVVSERPLNSSTGHYLSALTSDYPDKKVTFGIQAAADGDVDISGLTVVGVYGWAYAYAGAAYTGNIRLLGVEYPHVFTGATAAYGRAGAAISEYPTGTDVIGSATGSSQPASYLLYECGVVIAYLQPPDADVGVGLVSQAQSVLAATAKADVSPEVGLQSQAQSVLSAYVAFEYYVATTGSSGNDGSIDSPWDLATALSGASGAIQPGDTVYLRDGNYQGSFTETVDGSTGKYITFRSYQGEWARLDANGATTTTLTVNGDYVIVRDIEVYNSNPSSGNANSGISIDNCHDVKIINCIVHDHGNSGVGAWSGAYAVEIYGCVIYNNGRNFNLDHGIYAHNQGSLGSKSILQNVIANNYTYGLHLYGSGSAYVQNFDIEQNAVYQNGSIYETPKGQSFIGGDGNTDHLTLKYNTLYSSGSVGTNTRFGGWGTAPGYLDIEDNHILGGTPAIAAYVGATNLVFDGNEVYSDYFDVLIADTDITGAAWDNNDYYHSTGGSSEPFAHMGSSKNFATWKNDTGYDTNSSCTVGASVRPPDSVDVFTSSHTANRGLVIIRNWSHASSVNVDLSSIIPTGHGYELHNGEDYFNDIITGTYSGGNVSIPMTGHTIADPINLSPTLQSAAPEFLALVVIGVGSGNINAHVGLQTQAQSPLSVTVDEGNANVNVDVGLVSQAQSVYGVTFRA
ncbi:MAG TPA: right-handed parallel beta-helix repeat-containing protein, partial [Candidatus Paceibacterota bacterium]